MKQFTRRVRRYRRAFFDIRILVAISGLLLSVVLHELFHIAVHWGSITHLRIFPNTHAVVEIVATTPQGYNPQLEEAIAYTITFIVIFTTIAVLFRLSDRRDTRTFAQIVFPKNTRIQAMSPSERYQLALRAKVF